MTKHAKDNHPKILSFQQNITGIQIASGRNILWPCHAFKVSIPSRRKKALNIFEETILKLCATETCNTVKLADITCLETEIVKFIQYRLSQLNLLTDRFELTKDAKEVIEQWDHESEEYMAATVYVDLICGSLLPVVVSEAPQYENVMEASAGGARFALGTTGDRKPIWAKRLREKYEYLRNVPTSDDVSKTIKAFKNLHKRFSLLTENNIGLPPFYSKSEAITVQHEPEMVFIHCSVIVQKGNPDFLVTDAFGYGFSSVFKEALAQAAKNDSNFDKWIVRLKEEGLVKLAQQKQGVDPKSVNGLPSGFSDALFQYPDVRTRLNRAEEDWRNTNMPFSTSSQEKVFQHSVRKTLENLYDALEWTFRQVVFENPVDHWEQIFASQSYKDNNILLLKFAKNIGFTIPKSGNLLFEVEPGAIRAYSEGGVKMQPLLALAIAGASQDNQHPFNSLALNHTNSLTFIFKLKRFRNSAKHGGELDYKEIIKPTSFNCTMCSAIYRRIDKIKKCPNCGHKELTVNTRLIDDCRMQTHQIIKSLYPSLKSKTGEAKKGINVEVSDIDQLRLKARISLDNYFGISEVLMMPRNLSEELLKIELSWDTMDREPMYAPAHINSLASALQIALFIAITDYIRQINADEDLKVIAHAKSIEANFTLVDNKIPQCIYTSKERFIILACRGNSQSLQASLMTFLILMPIEKLATISGHAPDLLTLAARVVELRGHGNKSSEQILHELYDDDELLTLKENVFKIVKNLMEI